MPTNPLGPTGLLAQSLTLPAGSQSMAMGGMRMQAQGMDGRKKSRGLVGRYLLIGGGGGAGNSSMGGGGGGAGELREGSATLPSGALIVAVGLGGVGSNTPTNGGISSVADLFSRGGGAGGLPNVDAGSGRSGGSGGGGSSPLTGTGAGGLGIGENTNPGGSGEGVFGAYRAGGGGGGAGSAGTAGNSSISGSGGSGKASTITGASVLYAAGGRGQNDFVAPGSNGAGWGPNNGSGGGNGGDGQGGVFIWSYASPIQLCTGGTVTDYLDGSTRWWVHTFTSNGTLVVP